MLEIPIPGLAPNDPPFTILGTYYQTGLNDDFLKLDFPSYRAAFRIQSIVCAVAMKGTVVEHNYQVSLYSITEGSKTIQAIRLENDASQLLSRAKYDVWISSLPESSFLPTLSRFLPRVEETVLYYNAQDLASRNLLPQSKQLLVEDHPINTLNNLWVYVTHLNQGWFFLAEGQFGSSRSHCILTTVLALSSRRALFSHGCYDQSSFTGILFAKDPRILRQKIRDNTSAQETSLRRANVIRFYRSFWTSHVPPRAYTTHEDLQSEVLKLLSCDPIFFPTLALQRPFLSGAIQHRYLFRHSTQSTVETKASASLLNTVKINPTSIGNYWPSGRTMRRSYS